MRRENTTCEINVRGGTKYGDEDQERKGSIGQGSSRQFHWIVACNVPGMVM